MPDCELCGLTTPDPPVTDGDVDGAFCCRGCLEVARRLDDADARSSTEADPRSALKADADASTDSDAASEETETEFLAVDGMHCTTCEAFLEAKLIDRDGVVAADASYASELVRVEYDPERIDADVLPTVASGHGYEARHVDDDPGRNAEKTPWRLVVGGIAAVVAMPWYLTLYPTYLGIAPGPSGGVVPLALGVIWAAASVVLFYTGFPILRGAYVGLRAGYPNMDLLIALAAGGAYVYSASVVALGGMEVYFDITIVVVLVVTLGNRYEERVKRRAIGSLAELTRERVDEARRRGPDGIERVSVDELRPGDELLVKPGERIPIDGTVLEGSASVDESIVTGESRPVRKSPGDDALGGTLLTDAPLEIEVHERGESTLDRLVTHLWNVQSSNPGTQRIADRLATVFVPLVITLAAVAFLARVAAGSAPAAALVTGLSVLVVACPCALGLATPLAVAAGVRAALRRGIVMTNEAVFERAADVETVVFDKTGTLSTGEMYVVESGDDGARRRAAAVEQYADHPIGEAIVDRASPPDVPVANFETYPGHGVGADVDGERVLVGHPDLFEEHGWSLDEDLRSRVDDARSDGHVPVVVGWEGAARSVVVVGDRPRENWEEVVEALAEGGRRVVVLTGDEERTTGPYRDHPDVDEVFAGVPPEAKAEVLERLAREGTTAMVGDGSNDALALATADLGIALESGTALAADAADVVVTTDDLTALPAVFETTGATRRRIHQNLGWAFCYNAVAIPVAMAGYLNPLVAAVAMATSSLLVVGNSSRSFPRPET